MRVLNYLSKCIFVHKPHFFSPSLSLSSIFYNFFFPVLFLSLLNSYSDVVCRERTKASKQMYDKQFKSEIKNLEAMQASAYDQMRFHRLSIYFLCFLCWNCFDIFPCYRFFAITTLWPPLHSRKEVDYTIRTFYQPSQKHLQRLNYILENTIWWNSILSKIN